MLTEGSRITVQCRVPIGETILPNFWNTSAHVWDQKLVPSTVNWGGRQVRERDFDAAADGCWFDGSTRTPVSGVTRIDPFTIGSDGRYSDTVGWGPVAVSFYRVERPARSLPLPCAALINQEMQMLCPPSDWRMFTQNVLVFRIGLTTVESERSRLRGPVNKVSRTYP
jgi:hypothetical protein